MKVAETLARVVTQPRLILLIVAMLVLAGLGSLSGMARQEDPAFPRSEEHTSELQSLE